MSEKLTKKHVAEQSQWALILREFRKRKLAVLSWWIILFLISLSVFAPFIANNKPIHYVGVNRYAYEDSSRTITTLAQKISRLPAEPSPEQLVQARREIQVIRAAGNSIIGELDETRRGEIEPKLDEIVETAQQSLDDAQARSRLAQLRTPFREATLAAGKSLADSSHWPVLASLVWSEIWVMVFTVMLVFLPLWKPLTGKLDPTGQRRIFPLTFVLLPTLLALGWWWAVPERHDPTPYREGLLKSSPEAEDAPVTFDSVTWPLVPFALDEADLNHLYGKPAHLSGLTAPILQPEQAAEAELLPWSRPHVMGTDDTGRDVLSRMIWGGRISLSVGIVAVSIYVLIGIVVGATAGYFRGRTDMVISRIIEVVICFPSFFLILTIVTFLGPSIFNIMLVIGLTSWTGVARLVRGEFLRLSEQEFVMAGRALGYSSSRIIFRHILPNAMAPVMVSATFGIAGAILTESALSFLNLGISIPTPSWGGIMVDGRKVLTAAPWLIFYPGLAIFITITANNLVGEAFRDAADPRLRGRH